MKNFFYLLLINCFLVGSSYADVKLLTEKDPALLTSHITVVFKSGAIQDPPGKKGVAYLLSQLVLRGTRAKNRQQFQSQMERLGGTIASAAAHDRIAFTLEVIGENTKSLVELLAEALQSPAFDAKEFKNLLRETTDKIQVLKNSNGTLASLALRKAVYAGTPMESPDFGTLSSLKKITLKDLVSYYNTYFTQSNMLMGAATALDDHKVQALAHTLSGKLLPGAPFKTLLIEPTLPKEPQLIVVHKPKTETGTLMMGQKGYKAQDETRYALRVGDNAFGGEPLVARLFKTIRSELGWTYSIHSGYAQIPASNQSGLYVISSTPSIEFTSKTLFKTFEMWKDYLSKGLEKPEIHLAQEGIVNSYPFEFATAESRLHVRVLAEIYGINIPSPEEYEKIINDIDNKQIKAALSSHHTENGWVVAAVADNEAFAKQLEAAQSETPKEKQLKISKVLTPNQLIE